MGWISNNSRSVLWSVSNWLLVELCGKEKNSSSAGISHDYLMGVDSFRVFKKYFNVMKNMDLNWLLFLVRMYGLITLRVFLLDWLLEE